MARAVGLSARVAYASADLEPDAARLARSLSLPLWPDPVDDWRRLEAGWWLLCAADGLSLALGGSRSRPLHLDFSAPRIVARLRRAGPRREAIGRALGLGPAPAPTVVDATAGLGRDALVLARLGCRVIMIERHPWLAALLADALGRAARDEQDWLRELAGRMTLEEGDARDRLGPLLRAGAAELVFLDPMFIDGRGSAAARRDMALLQRLHGEDSDPNDAVALLDVALAAGARRVVVKRPVRAAPLGARAPAHVIAGEAVRFDVYLSG